jgi:hypothetical protein
MGEDEQVEAGGLMACTTCFGDWIARD